MTDETPPASEPPGNRPRKRQGPTIELEATEVASAKENAGQTAGGEPQPATRRAFAWWVPVFPWRLIGAAAAGGALVLLVIFILKPFSTHDNATGVLETRVARLERQIRDLTDRPPPVTVDPKTVADLVNRVVKLEAVTGRSPSPDPEVLNRLATFAGDLKALDEKIGIVTRRTDDIALIARDARQLAQTNAAAIAELTKKLGLQAPSTVTRGEIDGLSNRSTVLEQGIKSIQSELGRRGIGQTGDRVARLALIAAALNIAVERGDPFAAELAAAKSLAPDPPVLGPLELFAAAGVPSAAALGLELVALCETMAQLAGIAPRNGTLLERLQANAERLVRVRPIDEVAGDDPASIIARIEVRATRGDLAGALADLAKLPDAARAPAQAWIAKAKAQIAALALSRRFAADAFAALAQAP